MRRLTLLLSCSLAGLGCGDDIPSVLPTTSTEAAASGSDTTSADAAVPASDGVVDDTGAPVGCGPSSPANLADCVDAAAYEEDVRFVADIRVPGDTHWLAVQEMCADRLEMLGYDLVLQDYGTGVNVLGFRPGTTRPNDIVLVGAHYDHIPGCLGADDNATGVGAVLEVARVLADVPTEQSLGIACWDQEELGLLGSTAFVTIGLGAGQAVTTYFNYDMIGITRHDPDTQAIPLGLDAIFPAQYAEIEANEFRGDFVTLIADDLAAAPVAAFEAHADARGLPNIAIVLSAALKLSDPVADLRRSDHAPFWFTDVPALFFTDTAELRHPNYHCIGAPDTPDALDFPFAADVVAASVGAIADTLVLAP
jgi:hypothetical protein